MRTWVVLNCLALLCACVTINLGARALSVLAFPNNTIAQLAMLFVLCFPGGAAASWLWSKVTWRWRRRELRKQWDAEK